ncbi:MAG: twin-arginine translocase subunit TatB [Rhodospirillales bacterium]|nr:twin-arginine translocase subunit TatB [Rhodospirillales bacterium]MBO6786481.1 twin-arginine translocase subunit TatB [Rhodospirillales bacterium]
MFDIGWQELFLVAIIALIVVGPKDLPRALKAVTGAIRKVKGMARDFQSGLDDIVRESELDEMRKQIEGGPGADFRKEIENSIDPDGKVAKDLSEMRDFEGDLTKAAQGYGDDVKKTEEDARAGLPDENDAMTFTPPEPEPEKEAVSADNASGDKPDDTKKSGEG